MCTCRRLFAISVNGIHFVVNVVAQSFQAHPFGLIWLAPVASAGESELELREYSQLIYSAH